MSRRTLALLLAVLVLGLGVAWIATRAGPAVDPSDVTAARTEPEQAATSASSVELAQPDAPAKADAPRPAARTSAPSVEKDALPVDALWIEGRVEFPPGTPRDERVAVVARGKKIGDSPEQRAEVDAQGNFRVAFAAGTTKGTIDVDARYVFLRQPQKLDATKPDAALVLKPELGGLLRLRLVPSALAQRRGVDFTKARAQVWPDSEGNAVRSRFATPDADGVAELGGLASGVQWYPSVALHGFASDLSHYVAPKAGEVLSIDAALTAAPRIAGVVRDARGAPIAGATIRVELQTSDTHSNSASNSSGKDGRFEVFVAGRGTATIRAERPGFLGAGADPMEVAEGFERDDIALQLDDGLAIEGVVRWADGSPAAGASLALHLASAESGMQMFGSDTPEQSLRAGDDGTFRITGLEAARYALAARARREAAAGAKSDRVWWTGRRDDVEPGARDIVLVLVAGAGLRGRVVDDLAQPVASATVRAEPTGAAVAGRGNVSGRVRDKTGAFELAAVPDGEWTLVARGRNENESARVSVVMPRDAQRAVDLVLPRPVTIAGRVVDFDGAPAAGAVVVLSEADGQRDFAPDETPVAADGTFRVEHVRATAWTILAKRNDRAASAPQRLDPVPGQALDGIALALRRGGTIEGRVRDAQDAPRANVVVNAYPTGPHLRSRETRTAADGTFRIEAVEPGTLTVSAMSAESTPDPVGFHDGSDYERKTVAVEEGATVRVELGGAPTGRILVTGRVTAGAPVADVQLSWWELESREGLSEREHDARTDADGRYELRLDTPGMYYVRGEASGLGSVERRVEVKDVERQVVDLEFGKGRLAGRVVGPDGRPIAQAHVFIGHTDNVEHDAASTSGMGPSKADGTFDFGGLMPGTYRIEVSPPWSLKSDQLAPARVPAIALAAGEQRTDLEIRLERGCSVLVRVVGSDGKPAKGARVGWEVDGRNRDTERTDAAGVARLDGLSPGAGQVTARTQFEAAREPVRVVASTERTEEVTITLVPGGRLKVRLERRDGTAIAQPWQHSIQLTDASGAAIEANWDGMTEGSLDFGPMTPGPHHVLVHFAKMRVEKDVVIVAGQEREVVLREPE